MHSKGHIKRGRPEKAAQDAVDKEDSITYKALQSKVSDLEKENKRLSALLSRNSHPSCLSSASSSASSCVCNRPVVTVKRKKSPRIKNCSAQQRIILLVASLDQDSFKGSQGNQVGSSLRAALLHALKTTSLVENIAFCDLQGCSSSKGEVNEFGKHPFEVMVAVTVQSRIRKDHVTHASEMKKTKDVADTMDDGQADHQEVNYSALLNEVLPTNIRVLAWCPAHTELMLPSSSSLNTLHTYKYFFPSETIDVEAMNAAAQKLVGQHWVPSHCRELVRISVTDYEPDTEPHRNPMPPQRESSMHSHGKLPKFMKGYACGCACGSQDTIALSSVRYKICVLTLMGRGFTWMDIRKVVSALLMVGKTAADEGKRKLLNMNAILRGQELCPVEESSLHLYHTKHKEELQWVWDRQALVSVVSHLQQHWTHHALRATAFQAFLQGYEAVLGGMLGILHTQNITGQETFHHSSSSNVPTDHEYSTMMEKGDSQSSNGHDSGHDPSLVTLLVQLVGPQVFKLMTKDSSQEAALLKLHSQIIRCGVPVSLASVAHAWKDLLASYGKARHQWLSGKQVEWEHFNVLDALLSGYNLPASPSEDNPTHLLPSTGSGSAIASTTMSLQLKKNPSQKGKEEVDWECDQEEDGKEDEENQENHELELEVLDDENEMVLLVEPSLLSLSDKDSLIIQDAHETFTSDSCSIGKSSEMDDFIVKSETLSRSSPTSPSSFSLMMAEEDNKNKTHIKKDSTLSNARKQQKKTLCLKRISFPKEIRDESRKCTVKKEKVSQSLSSKLFLHHEKAAVYAIEVGHQHTTDPTDIFLEYQLQRGQKRKERLEECLSFQAKKDTQRKEYQRRREQVEEESLVALKEIDKACDKLKTRLMEV